MSVEIEKVEKQSISRFDFLKATGDKHVATLKAIIVTDDTSEAILTQQLSAAKGFTSEIESLRVIVGKPYLETTKNINKTAKEIASPVDEIMATKGAELLAWKQKKAAAAKLEVAAAEAIQKKIIDYQSKAFVAISKCNTTKELSEAFKAYIIAFPEDVVWGKFVADAAVMKKAIKDFGSLRKKQIDQLAVTPIEKAIETITAQQVATAEVIVQNLEPKMTASSNAIAIASIVKTTGTRKDWKSKVLNINEVPMKFLMVDEAKVNEYMRAQVKTGKFVPGITYQEFGIEYKQEESLTIRS